MEAGSGRSSLLPTSAEFVKRNMINEAIDRQRSGLCDFFCTCFVSVVAGAEARDASPVEVPSLSEFFATITCDRICLKIKIDKNISNYFIFSISSCGDFILSSKDDRVRGLVLPRIAAVM